MEELNLTATKDNKKVYEILEELIKEWKKEGYKFKPLYSIML